MATCKYIRREPRWHVRPHAFHKTCRHIVVAQTEREPKQMYEKCWGQAHIMSWCHLLAAIISEKQEQQVVFVLEQDPKWLLVVCVGGSGFCGERWQDSVFCYICILYILVMYQYKSGWMVTLKICYYCPIWKSRFQRNYARITVGNSSSTSVDGIIMMCIFFGNTDYWVTKFSSRVCCFAALRIVSLITMMKSMVLCSSN